MKEYKYLTLEDDILEKSLIDTDEDFLLYLASKIKAIHWGDTVTFITDIEEFVKSYDKSVRFYSKNGYSKLDDAQGFIVELEHDTKEYMQLYEWLQLQYKKFKND